MYLEYLWNKKHSYENDISTYNDEEMSVINKLIKVDVATRKFPLVAQFNLVFIVYMNMKPHHMSKIFYVFQTIL